MLIAALFCGCKRSSAPAGNPPKIPAVQAISKQDLEIAQTSLSDPHSTADGYFSIRSYVVPANLVPFLGLSALLPAVGTTNSITNSGLRELPLPRLAAAYSNANVSLQQHPLSAGFAESNAFASFQTVLTNSAELALATSGTLAMRLARTGMVSTTSAMTCIIHTGPANFIATNLNFGSTVELVAASLSNGATAVRVINWTDTFLGYAISGNGRIPKANFTTAAWEGHGVVSTNKPLILLSPSFQREQIERWTVPGLSKLPAFGRYFRRTRVHTNYLHSLIIIEQR